VSKFNPIGKISKRNYSFIFYPVLSFIPEIVKNKF